MKESLSISDREYHLRNILKLLKASHKHQKGVVAAGVVDPVPDNVVYAVSYDEGPNQCMHAERVALKQFHEKYGEASDSAWVITTLSPCAKVSRTRIGDTCTNLLRNGYERYDPIPRAHVGYLDPWQISVDGYDSRGVYITSTEDPELERYCSELFSWFEREDYERDELPDFVDEVLVEL